MLDHEIRQLAEGTNFAALATVMPDGAIQNQVVWIGVDDRGEHLLINTEIDRQKARNVERRPQVGIAIWDAENPYRYAEVRGRVVEVVKGDEARAHIDALSRRYTGDDYGNPIGSERVILVVAPGRQRLKG